MKEGGGVAADQKRLQLLQELLGSVPPPLLDRIVPKLRVVGCDYVGDEEGRFRNERAGREKAAQLMSGQCIRCVRWCAMDRVCTVGDAEHSLRLQGSRCGPETNWTDASCAEGLGYPGMPRM